MKMEMEHRHTECGKKKKEKKKKKKRERERERERVCTAMARHHGSIWYRVECCVSCSLMWINWSRMVRQCSVLQLRYRESSTATHTRYTHRSNLNDGIQDAMG